MCFRSTEITCKFAKPATRGVGRALERLWSVTESVKFTMPHTSTGTVCRRSTDDTCEYATGGRGAWWPFNAWATEVTHRVCSCRGPLRTASSHKRFCRCVPGSSRRDSCAPGAKPSKYARACPGSSRTVCITRFTSNSSSAVHSQRSVYWYEVRIHRCPLLLVNPIPLRVQAPAFP